MPVFLLKACVLICCYFTLMSPNCIAQDIRGLYVNEFKNIIGDSIAETELLTFARDQGFNYLLLYNLYFIHTQKFDITDVQTAQPLADFMRRARQEYGIRSFGAVGETARSFDRFKKFNQLYTDQQAHFDIFNLEFEFWNKNMIDKYYCDTYLAKAKITCDTAGAFQYYHEQMLQIKQKAQAANAKLEVYIGKPTRNQCQIIGELCDRVLVHYYRKSPRYNNQNSIYNYLSYRLPALAPRTGTLDVMPIFGGGPKFMGEWLATHTLKEAFDIYKDGKNGWYPKDESWKDKINLIGAQWYRYTDLKEDLHQDVLPFDEQSPVILTCCIDSQIALPKFQPGTAHLRLLDMEGNLLTQTSDTAHDLIKINTDKIPAGIYYLILEQDKASQLFKIAISRE